MLHQTKQFLNYLMGKRSELSELKAKDVLLAKTILDIHRKRTHSSFTLVPLFSLKQIHAIDHDNAIEATKKRSDKLTQHKDFLLQHKRLDNALLTDILPSISSIKVVKQSNDTYIAYEGNGRLAAMQAVFSPSDEIMIEVEQYHFKKPATILKKMTRVRRLNGFTD